MSAQAKFVFWWENVGANNEPLPFFNLASNGSTVDGETLLSKYGIPLPLFPSYETWKRETNAKRRCFRCWKTTKGVNDLARHREVVHHERLQVAV